MASAKNILVLAGCFWILACQNYDGNDLRWSHVICSSDRLLTFPDIFYLSDEDEVLRIERDMNQDGSIDRWEYFEGSPPIRIELDSNYDGTIDLWARIGPEGDLLELNRDSDGDGLPDQIVPREEALPLWVNLSLGRRLVRGGECLHGRECSLSPACCAYLKEITEQVYLRWSLKEITEQAYLRWSPPGDAGAVTVRFRISENGRLFDLEIIEATNEHLGATCLRAMEEFEPIGPAPKECADLVRKDPMTATFRYRP